MHHLPDVGGESFFQSIRLSPRVQPVEIESVSRRLVSRGIRWEEMRNDPRRRRRKKMVRKRDDGLWRIRRRRASCNDFSPFSLKCFDEGEGIQAGCLWYYFVWLSCITFCGIFVQKFDIFGKILEQTAMTTLESFTLISSSRYCFGWLAQSPHSSFACHGQRIELIDKQTRWTRRGATWGRLPIPLSPSSSFSPD